jgi:hypothetical protein
MHCTSEVKENRRENPNNAQMLKLYEVGRKDEFQ